MTKIVDRIKGFFRTSRQEVPEPKWVDSSQNQFGVRLLDLRSSVFSKVKDSAMLDKLSAGDKVKFKAIQTDGGLWVTELQTIQ